jgi:5-methylthioadenosine/S-adenosylhomocysteine deaminase
MATLEGAAALGLETTTGSLVPGKWADLCTVRLGDWISQPCYDPASHVVHVAGRDQVSHVWVAGRLRICRGEPIGASPSDLIGIASSWHNRLSSADRNGRAQP